ncbi:DUF1847 domain-containing protein [Desulfotomaculum copahuensis]|uniref:DUF1847 domain-containing protein n=1 Tax=Desulfotomaculum copahuensis TaxID=1838280 RepID=A0A1B7LHB5_9FIRM|nr:DUF1847 domain-containing protein [Desulfotomaculum copahuensis]OAT85581.1 hypothetical protein A6M21_05540 [Desulfotomaculum copahuensis]
MKLARPPKTTAPATRLRFPAPRRGDTWMTVVHNRRPQENELSRLEEIILLARSAGCRRIGLAYCAELTPEARLFEKIMQNHFNVKMVPCQQTVSSQESFVHNGCKRPRCAVLCDPLAQSTALNRSAVDLNISLGLCTRQDILLKKCSTAPVTTLAVRDQALAHRPLEGLYGGYYFDLYGLRPGV